MVLLNRLQEFLMWTVQNSTLWRFKDDEGRVEREGKYNSARQLAGTSELPREVRFSNSIPQSSVLCLV